MGGVGELEEGVHGVAAQDEVQPGAVGCAAQDRDGHGRPTVKPLEMPIPRLRGRLDNGLARSYDLPQYWARETEMRL
jgi:hypothetical protein